MAFSIGQLLTGAGQTAAAGYRGKMEAEDRDRQARLDALREDLLQRQQLQGEMQDRQRYLRERGTERIEAGERKRQRGYEERAIGQEDAELQARAVAAVDAEPNGFYAVDMTRDATGVPRVTEINAGRPFTTATEFFWRLGLNLADIYIRAAVGETPVLPAERESPLPDGWLWIRGLDVHPTLVHESAVR